MQSDRSAAVVDNECIDQYSPSSALQEPSSTASSGRSSSPRQEEARPWATGPRWAPITPSRSHLSITDHWRQLGSVSAGRARLIGAEKFEKKKKVLKVSKMEAGGSHGTRLLQPLRALSLLSAPTRLPLIPPSPPPLSSSVEQRGAAACEAVWGAARGGLESAQGSVGQLEVGVPNHRHTHTRQAAVTVTRTPRTDTADTHSRSSHQRSQCFQSAAPAHTRTKSWEQKLLQLSASTSGWDHAHTPAAAVWVAEGACHSKGGGAQRRQSVKECGENVSAHVCFWNLETKSTKTFKFLKKAGTDLYARQCARFVALSAKCVVSVLFCVVCCVVTVLFRVTMRVIMNVTKQCKLSPGRNPDCCQGVLLCPVFTGTHNLWASYRDTWLFWFSFSSILNGCTTNGRCIGCMFR